MSYTRVNWVDGSGGGTPISHDNLNVMDAGVSTLDSTVNATTGADTATMPSSDGPFTFINWLKYLMTQLKAITGGAHWYTAPTTTISALSTGKAALAGAAFTGDVSVAGALTLSNVNAVIAPATNAGVELGNPAVSNTPFIDLHSSGNSIDYDVRVIASGGTGSVGQGTLDIEAGTLTLNGVSVVLVGSHNSISPLKISAGTTLPGTLDSREIFILLA